MSTSPPESRGLRISDADRARAAERLQVAMAEGRITMAELEERLAVVYGARYEGELVPPLADLPGPEPAGVPVPAVPSGPATVLRAGMATIKRTGAWSVPARLRVQSLVGSVLLDFTRADNPHPVVEVELEIAAGSVKLLLPDGATADIDNLLTALGEVRCRVPSRPRPGAPHFVVRGRCGLGSVVVRRRRRVADYFT
jgi:Domain of unknown function (DUF1707)